MSGGAISDDYPHESYNNRVVRFQFFKMHAKLNRTCTLFVCKLHILSYLKKYL